MLTLEDWSLIAEIVAAVGVIATLLYLAIEVRMTRVASEAQLYYSRVEVYSRWRSALMNNSDLSKAIAKANVGEALSADETIRLSTLADELFYAAAASHESTVKAESLYARSGDADYLAEFLKDNPGLLPQWRKFRGEFISPEFRLSVNRRIEELEIGPAVNEDK